MIRAVLFDLDGTLLDSAPDLVATLNWLRAGLGLKDLPMSDLRHFVSRGAVGLIKAGMPPCDQETLAAWREKFISHYRHNCFVETQPFFGVDYLLDNLQAQGVPWGIVTNKSEDLSFPILEQAGWLSRASAVICGDTVGKPKPEPEPVLAGCEKIGVEAAHTLMVGDDLRDITAGQRAGCRTAFVRYGYSDREMHSEIGAETALIDSPAEVLDLMVPSAATPAAIPAANN